VEDYFMKTIKVGKSFVFQTLALVLISGVCSAAWAQRADGGKRDVDVMTVNLYVGSELTPVTSLNPADPDYGLKLLQGVATIWGHVVASNFPVRAEALAREVAGRLPDLLALQEVSLFRRQSPGDAIVGGQVPATAVEADYLAILLNALERQGAHYAVVSMVQETDVEVPIATSPTTFDDLRLTDRDVILMRTDLPPGYLRVSNPMGSNFSARIPLPIGVNVLRGWCSVDVQIRGRRFRFINAHLEEALPPGFPDIQGFQAAELLLGPANTTTPVVLVGDFNSDAYGNYGPTVYPLLVGPGGFTDAWSVARPGALGLTWGHDELLSNPAVQHVFRLDFILYRGSVFHATDAETIDPLIGGSTPLWLSDHAVLAAEVAIQ
jgi:endonuclease/exonuclease/phosphatase family metal-dependent hydrolase